MYCVLLFPGSGLLLLPTAIAIPPESVLELTNCCCYYYYFTNHSLSSSPELNLQASGGGGIHNLSQKFNKNILIVK